MFVHVCEYARVHVSIHACIRGSIGKRNVDETFVFI